MFHSCLTIALAACLGLSAGAAAPRSVAELPVDRFDEYPAGAFPPWPWVRTHHPAAGVEVTLEEEAESPFVKNTVTGKGLVVVDVSAVAGPGQGIACDFAAPPAGDLYLGFDCRWDGLDFTVALSGPEGGGLLLDVGATLGLHQADGWIAQLAALARGKWYHVAIVLRPDGTVEVGLNDGQRATAGRIAPAAGYERLVFASSGPAAQTGSWSLDNICTAGRVDASRAAWWPFDQAPLEVLRASPRKVFAYYFIYSSGYDARDPGLSWYTRTVLNPAGNTKPDRAEAGTELLFRPLPRPPMAADLDADAQRLAARTEEVRLAIAQGMDGFLVDFWAVPHPTNGQAYFIKNSFALLDAAQALDPGFKILPAVYSNATKSGINGESDEGCDPLEYASSPVCRRILEHPATMRLADGRVAWSMWLTERHSVAWWQQVIAEFARQGHPVALICHFNSMGRLAEFSPIAAGMAHWGPREPVRFPWADQTRRLTPIVIYPVVMQDVRTRGCTLWECGGSETLTGLWRQAVADDADWAFIDTWSDYSEQALAPSTVIGFAPYDLNAYYIQWFKTGRQPPIVRDTLYYFYRKNRTDVDPGRGVTWKFRSPETPPRNEVELLAFLARPGTLRIEVAGQLYERRAAAGVTRFTAPLPAAGTFVPEFALLRHGEPVVRRRGHCAVLSKVEYPHLMYAGGVIAPDRAPEPRTWFRRLLD